MCVALGMYPDIEWDRYVTVIKGGERFEGPVSAWAPEEGWLIVGGRTFWLGELCSGHTRCGWDLHELARRFGWGPVAPR